MHSTELKFGMHIKGHCHKSCIDICGSKWYNVFTEMQKKKKFLIMSYEHKLIEVVYYMLLLHFSSKN